MAQLRPLDPAFPIDRQLAVAASPVVLINVHAVDANEVDALLEAWAKDANWMKKQPGFISTQLHRAIWRQPPELSSLHDSAITLLVPGPPPGRGPYFAAFPPGITNSTTTLRSRG